ncbi:hypothetical protein VN97_g8770 [Penicillium thymicola]|uniref:Uncharacterized protein n=1 Tax=Penicillium thymicola TaxID=293382 RepID=A0AAI9TCN3_PENTH|nr:hypothetical protein VN97_g8770 [Penicillium thymicola]
MKLFTVPSYSSLSVKFISLSVASTTLKTINLTLHHALRRPQRRPLLTGYEPLDALFTVFIVILHTASPSTPSLSLSAITIVTIVTIVDIDITGQATPINTSQ